jgi:hypothetical protein
MKTKEVTWDNQDDYCVAFFKRNDVEYEINIRICNNKFLVWVNNCGEDIEIVDEEFLSLFEVNGMMLAIFKFSINLPSHSLLKLIEGR